MVSILIGLSAVATNANDIQDDFSRDSGLWHFSGGGGKGKHVLQNNRLEFSTQETFTGNDSATHYWKVPIGSYDESWEVQADVFLGNFQLGNGNPYAGLALLVGNKSKPSRSFIRVQLRRGDKGHRAFNADAYEGRNYLGSEWADTTADTATIRIQFDAKSKLLTASYDADRAGASENFVSFYSIDIGKGPNSWHMKDKDVFEFSVVSQSTQTVVSSGDMHFDDVVVKNLSQ
ncbi:MAG TPA: hypothetical protein PLB55_00150 [Prosthecobacter sp.]|nr:hypothetical protein [Prosthecobacter sp.]